MRSRVLLMVALLATAGIMATMAYTSAEVRNPAQATIVRTDVALLALDCNEGVGYMDESCTVEDDGRLHLNFAKGLNQPGEPAEEEPVVVAVQNVQARSETGYKSKKDRWFEVDLVDDQGHKFPHLKTQSIQSYEIKEFEYDANGRCIDYTFRARTKNTGKEKDQWQTVSGSLCIPADHMHEGEPGPGAPGFYGFQPGSTYVFNNLVKVTNNSEDTIEIGYGTEGDLFNNGESHLDIQITLSETTLGPGEFAYISFAFDVPDDWADQTGNRFPNGDEEYPFDGTLTVTAQAVAAE